MISLRLIIFVHPLADDPVSLVGADDETQIMLFTAHGEDYRTAVFEYARAFQLDPVYGLEGISVDLADSRCRNRALIYFIFDFFLKYADQDHNEHPEGYTAKYNRYDHLTKALGCCYKQYTKG